MFSQFFIDRPRFAVVISIALAIAGVISALSLPIKQYPDITPPQIRVSATYPGADAKTLANTVAAPLEDEINGVDDMIYMSSTSSNSGSYSLTVTFKTGADTDMAYTKEKMYFIFLILRKPLLILSIIETRLASRNPPRF